MTRPPSLQINDLRFSYPAWRPGTPGAWVLDGLDLSAQPGEWLAVMGASDAGKTTLCLLASGLAPTLTGGTQEGTVRISGLDTREHTPPALASRIGLIFQDPVAQLFCPTVEAEVAWGLENLGTPPAEMERRIDRALSRFGIDAVRHRSPLALSGGERKRVALAAVLAMQPDLLVLDEPMGGLDPVGRKQVLTALSELRDERSITILMTESDPEAVASFATRLTVLSDGRLTVDALPRELLSHTAELSEAGVAVPQMAQVAAELSRRTGERFAFLSLDEARHALARWLAGQPQNSPRGRPDTVGRPAPAHGAAGHTALEIQGLWYWYDRESAPALRDVDLQVETGELVAIVGANGSGKTTLAQHLNGLLRPRRGSVRVLGQEIAGRSIGEMARQVGFLFQSPEQAIFAATVEQEIAFGPRNLGLDPTTVARRVDGALERFDLRAVAHIPPSILGYGLRRRLTLASLAAMEPPILVLDEPSVGLDARGGRELVGWLREMQASGRTTLLVTHDMALVAECADRVVVLSDGRILADGAPRTLFDRPSLLAEASLIPPPVVELGQALRPAGLAGLCLTVPEICDQMAKLAGLP